MKAMVLAAGVGSRLEPLTSRVPKPLVPITNVPVMEHIVRLLKHHGYDQLIANLHYLPKQLETHFGDGSKFGVDITFRFERDLSGDAGGVRACRDFLGDDTFLVLMGDLLTDCDLTAIVAEHKRKGALASIAVKQVPDVEHFGVVVRDENGFITGFQEKPKQEEALSNLASTGIYVLEPEVFDHMPRDGMYGFGRQLFPELLKKGAPVLGVEFKSYWSDVGTIAQYRQSNFDALDGLVGVSIPGRKSMDENGVVYMGDEAYLDEKVQINGRLLLGKRSELARGTRCSGSVIIGDNCIVEEDVVLHNVLVWPNSRIERGASLENCIVGDGCIIPKESKHNEVTTMAQPSPQYSCAKPAP